jgi:hypothetical protein
MKPLPIAIAAALLMAAALWYFTRPKAIQEQSIEETPVQVDRLGPEGVNLDAASEPITASAHEPSASLPDLEESDPWLSKARLEISGHPYWSRVLEMDGVVRRLVNAVDRIAQDGNPYGQVAALRPPGTFTPDGKQEAHLGPANHARYQALITAIESADAASAARLYRVVEPWFQQAWLELGQEQASWAETLDLALQKLIDTPLPLEPPLLQASGSVWMFQEPSLEALPSAQKALIRMGNRQAGVVIAKLKEFRAALKQLR